MLLAILANAITLERVYQIEFEVDSLEDEVKMVMDRGICTLYNLKQTLHAGAYPVFSEGGGGARSAIWGYMLYNGWNCIKLE